MTPSVSVLLTLSSLILTLFGGGSFDADGFHSAPMFGGRAAGEHEDATLAEATFAARRKRKLAWADAPLSPVKGVGGVGVMCDGPDGAVHSAQLRATPRSPGGRASLKTHRMQVRAHTLTTTTNREGPCATEAGSLGRAWSTEVAVHRLRSAGLT